MQSAAEKVPLQSVTLDQSQLDHNMKDVFTQLLREPLWEMCTNLTFTYMIDREGHDDDNNEPKLFP